MNEIVVDACCFINLYATGDVCTLLKDLSWTCYLPQVSMNEAIYVRGKDEHGEIVHTAIDVQDLLHKGLIQSTGIEGSEEANLYVRLASDLDDGEAMAMAIAKQRGWQLATDDRKARRLARDLDVMVATTAEIMRKWADSVKPTAAKVAQVLRNIEFGARFAPAENMPEYAWWTASRLP